MFVCLFFICTKVKIFLPVNEVCVLVTLSSGMDCFVLGLAGFFFSTNFVHVTFFTILKIHDTYIFFYLVLCKYEENL